MPALSMFSRSPRSPKTTTVDSSKKRNGQLPAALPIVDPSVSVHDVVERIRRASPFLKEPSRQVTAHFYRDEIQVGNLLRAGEFAHVYQVCGLPHYHTTNNNNNNVVMDHQEPPSSILAATGGDGSATMMGSLGFEDGTHFSSHFSVEEEERRRICTALASGAAHYSLKVMAAFSTSKKKTTTKDHHSTTTATLYPLAAATLVIEAQFLARLNHPSIIKLRGVPLGEEAVLDSELQNNKNGFFLLTDMIVETLAERIDRWKEQEKEQHLLCNQQLQQDQGNNHNANLINQGGLSSSLKLDTKSPMFQEKLQIAQDIISALDYLHKRRIVAMNLNPYNIGFQMDGKTAQLFDLGHCREIPVEPTSNGADDEHGGGYTKNNNDRLIEDELSMDDLSVMLGSPIVASTKHANAAMPPNTNGSVNTGTFRKIVPTSAMGVVPRYLAPEIVCQGQYSLKSDAYSFALIVFEMMTLSLPYATYQPGQHFIKVCIQGKRPNIALYQFPPTLDNLIRQGWKHNWNKRLSISTMKQVLTNVEFSKSSGTGKSAQKRERSQQQLTLAAEHNATIINATSGRKKSNRSHKSKKQPSDSPPHQSPDARHQQHDNGAESHIKSQEGKIRRERRRRHSPDKWPEPEQAEQRPQRCPSASLSPQQLQSFVPDPAPAVVVNNVNVNDADRNRKKNRRPSAARLLDMVSPASRKKATAKMASKIRRQHQELYVQDLDLEPVSKVKLTTSTANTADHDNAPMTSNMAYIKNHEQSQKMAKPPRRRSERALLAMVSPGSRKRQTVEMTAARRHQHRMSI